MSDRITTRALIIASAAHAVVVLAAWWGGAGTPPPIASPPVPTTAPAPTSTRTRALAELVLAPESAAAADSVAVPALPPLPGDRRAALPELPITRPGRTDAPDLRDSAGTRGPAYAATDLPMISGGDDTLSRHLRARRANPALDHEAELRRDAATLIEGWFVTGSGRRAPDWRRFAARITSRTLVFDLTVDARGHVERGALIGSTGVEELDRAIGEWLVRGMDGKGLFLPPLPGGRHFYPAITLR